MGFAFFLQAFEFFALRSIQDVGIWNLLLFLIFNKHMVAGLTGGAMALNGLEAVVWSQWLKVVYGIFISVLLSIIKMRCRV